MDTQREAELIQEIDTLGVSLSLISPGKQNGTGLNKNANKSISPNASRRRCS